MLESRTLDALSALDGDPMTACARAPERILHAYRLAARFGFPIEPAVRAVLRAQAGHVRALAPAQVRAEFIALLEQARVPGRLAEALQTMQDDGVLVHLLPELSACVGVTQNAHHAFDVFRHIIEAADAAGASDWRRRFALVLHDLGKPETRTVDPLTGVVHFYTHEQAGAEIAARIVARWGFTEAEGRWLVGAVRYHMALMDAGEGVAQRFLRRLARKLPVGLTLRDLLAIRQADKAGAGPGRALPAGVVAEIEAGICALEAAGPITPEVPLALRGSDEVFVRHGLTGPQIGAALTHLRARVAADAQCNTVEALRQVVATLILPADAVAPPRIPR